MNVAKRLTALALALTLGLSLVSCTPATPAPNPSTPPSVEPSAPVVTAPAPAASDPTYGGDLTVYFQEFYNDYDPSVADNRPYALFYESLFTLDWARKDSSEVFTTEYMTMDWMTGQIAESYTFQDSDLTIKLRGDVFFQDKAPYGGRQCVADDVRWSYARLLGLDEFEAPYACDTNWSAVLYMVESIEVVDERTIIFHFNTDSELALNSFITAQVCIGGKEWDALTATEKADWRNAAGTGPFILSEFAPDNYMKFTRNEKYYDYDERYPDNKLPYLDTLTLQMVSDSTNALTQFTAGNLDIIAWGGNVLTQTQGEMLAATAKPGSFVQYDFASSPPGVGLKQTHPALADLKVRQALQLAINSEEIYRDYYGYGDLPLNIPGLFATVTQYSAVDQWSDALKSEYTYNPEQAKALLTEAGYGDGFTFDVVIFGALDVDLFTLVASYLSQVGVTMNVTVATSPMEMQQVGFDKTNQKSIFVSGGWARMQSIYNMFHSAGANNSILATDAKMDDLLTRFNAAETMADAIAVGQEADLYFAQQHWVMHLGGAEIISTFLSSSIGGYTGERLWKNWNGGPILARLWVNE